jgi:hypothetical protein
MCTVGSINHLARARVTVSHICDIEDFDFDKHFLTILCVIQLLIGKRFYFEIHFPIL